MAAAPPSPFKCARCEAPLASRDPACPQCGALRVLPESVTHFEVLGVEPALTYAPALLQERFYALSKQTHPDRFAAKEPSQALLANRWSTAVNRAYQTLRDPDRLAHYLLDLHGMVQAPSSQVPLELADTYFELQDALEEPGGGEALARFREDVRAMLADLDQERERLAGEWNANPKKVLEALRKHLTLRRFLNSMLADIARRTENP